MIREINVVLATTVFTVGCLGGASSDRWYDDEQVQLGADVYSTHCASCHGAEAEGTPDWQTPLADRTFPPPPLNGTAHTWHHSLDVLLSTLDQGGAAFGGKMPAFRDSLSAEEKLAVLAYVQSLWPQEVYDQWRLRS